jgi:DNA-binding NarL/FixJ family response regulator
MAVLLRKLRSDPQIAVAKESIGGAISIETSASTHTVSVTVIAEPMLFRQCLISCLKSEFSDQVNSFADVNSWHNSLQMTPASRIILLWRCQKGRGAEINEVSQSSGRIPIVLISDDPSLNAIVSAFAQGVRGYMLTSMPFKMVAGVIRLVIAGGVFAPPEVFIANYRSLTSNDVGAMFTRRQVQVMEALQLGKPNKVIAHELNLSESTVKVHVKSIMRKMSVTNRTEAAIKAASVR